MLFFYSFFIYVFNLIDNITIQSNLFLGTARIWRYWLVFPVSQEYHIGDLELGYTSLNGPRVIFPAPLFWPPIKGTSHMRTPSRVPGTIFVTTFKGHLPKGAPASCSRTHMNTTLVTSSKGHLP